ncbi:galactosylgalactosylxylosylprotein 3-beta-glucuronosyltransferase 1-like [Strongylocentrotus purpuratus]|uniref:Galactosylgalactosylxylosylprotein 3-beta-glucuronosyltransferase n=1 Tax=Strongylocentrotus purpuratus TaxID=7668 RepID=A0A7M7P373_STRPU|nr:galactosylgalactosylxylosylprotein 3-beta-glucuronosyltransferase 1-like [Strongylocentrotus purpuratus]
MTDSDAQRTILDETQKLALLDETQKLALLEETQKLALLNETQTQALLDETQKLALLDETQKLALLDETQKLALMDETQKLALLDETQKLALLDETQKLAFPVGGDSKTSPVERDSKTIPTIYAITPTYTRPVQKAELTRVSQTFLHVSNFHWIVVEDTEKKTQLVSRLLTNSGLTYTHLNVKKQDKTTHRGIPQRNIGIDWILENVTRDQEGVVYFADDDNTYNLRLFEEMRTTQKVSIWPVGLVGGIRFESPILNDAGKVSSWHTMYAPDRAFAIDMAGFAVSLKYFRQQSHVRFDPKSRPGWVEPTLLVQLGLKKEDLEPRAENCSKVLVWHTKTQNPDLSSEKKLIALGKPSDPTVEV